MLHFVPEAFPKNASVKDACGLPWGCIVQPCGKLPLKHQPIPANQVARCEKCFAFINPYVKFRHDKWVCSLCYHHNITPERYNQLGARTQLPELLCDSVEFEGSISEKTSGKEDQTYDSLIFLADVTCDETGLELLRGGVMAALEAVHDDTLICFITMADTIGLWDLKAPLPHMKRIPVKSHGPIVEFGKALPLDRLFVAARDCRDIIPQICDALRTSLFVTSGNLRPLGAAVQGLLEASAAVKLGLGRVLLFQSGLPNFGPGTLIDRSASVKPSAKDNALLQPALVFYQQLAEKAAASRLSIDILLTTTDYVDLASWYFLANLTGGTVMKYDPSQECTLPQDIYRRLHMPFSNAALLRMRTTSNMKVARADGQMTPDLASEGLYHVPAMNPSTTFAFDLEFTGSAGFSQDGAQPPTIQLATSFTVFVNEEASVHPLSPVMSLSPPDMEGHVHQLGQSLEAAHIDDASGSTWSQLPPATAGSILRRVMKRRMRIETKQVPVATHAAQLYSQVDAEAVVYILTHKVIKILQQKSLQEARTLLKDWLTVQIAKYNAANHTVNDGTRPITDLDTHFMKHVALQALPRYIFALLQSPLLKENVDPDQRIFHQILYRSLPPQLLVRALYPSLHSFSSPDMLIGYQLPLSAASMNIDGSPLFLLDAYTTVIIYYAKFIEGMPYPPPMNSKIRQIVNESLDDRPITPQIIVVAAETPQASLLRQHLVEEADGGYPFSDFMEQINVDVSRHIKK